MKLKELIVKLQEIDSKYGRDLEVITLCEIGPAEIYDIRESFVDFDECELEDLEDEPDIHVNSVYLKWI